jgi:23S rRNA (guanine745-N1)-methyltransferase
MLFLCPKCKKELNIEKGFCRCENGHAYDRAKEGYYNFLIGRSGGIHGDNIKMVQARRDFLQRGYYFPLARRLSELILLYTEKGGRVLDSGCGEGYYTDIVEKSLFERDGESLVSGFDISKDAVKRAARVNPRMALAVASSYDMPIGDGAVDIVYNVFSPLALSETGRVLKSGGKFIMAIPDEEHLFELKAAVYDTPYKNKVENTEIPGFKLLLRENLRYKMELDSREAVSSLFMMTPYAYRTSPENIARMEKLDSLLCRAEFILLVYEKL